MRADHPGRPAHPPQATLRLTGQEAGESWYGVLFEPGPAARVEVPDGSLDIRDSRHGLVMPERRPERTA